VVVYGWFNGSHKKQRRKPSQKPIEPDYRQQSLQRCPQVWNNKGSSMKYREGDILYSRCRSSKCVILKTFDIAYEVGITHKNKITIHKLSRQYIENMNSFIPEKIANSKIWNLLNE